MLMLNQRSLTKLIGDDTELDKKTQVINSVIGNNVKIRNPIRIANSVIFDNVKLNANLDITNSIVTPDRVVSCQAIELASSRNLRSQAKLKSST